MVGCESLAEIVGHAEKFAFYCDPGTVSASFVSVRGESEWKQRDSDPEGEGSVHGTPGAPMAKPRCSGGATAKVYQARSWC